MSCVVIDGLWQKEASSNLIHLVEKLGIKDYRWYPHDLHVSQMELDDGDSIFGYSMGGNTAIDLINANPYVKVKQLIAIEPVFGWNFFGKKRVVSDQVKSFLQVKATNTLLWAIWSYYVRSTGTLYPQDKFLKVKANHANVANHCFDEVNAFLMSGLK